MGRAEYWDPVTQSRKPIKSGSIVNNSGLEYTPDDVKAIDNKINNLNSVRVSIGNTQPTDTVFWLDTSED